MKTMRPLQHKRDDAQIEHLSTRFCEIKLAGADAKAGTFSGYGAFFGNEDSYGDVIEHGAFAETLAEWKATGKFPPMLLQHGGGFFGRSAEDMVPVGKWEAMREDGKGLRVEGRLFAMNTERVQRIYEAMKEGELDGLSIGFRTREARLGTKPGEPDRTLTNVDLVEVSIVTFPANPKARVTTVKMLTAEEWRVWEGALRDEGLSHRDAKAALSVFRRMLQRDAGVPDLTHRDDAVPEVSDGQRILDGLMLDELNKLLRVIR
jgi:HK97 family phage prohead protease